jgi:hypothetical protein
MFWRKKDKLKPKYFEVPKPFWRFALVNFTGGIFRGVGYFIGITVVVGLLIWILSWFPFFDSVINFFVSLRDSVM